MTTVAEIAAEAFTGAAAEFTDIIKAVTLTRTAQTRYNPSTGQHDTTDATATGRGLFDTSTAIGDVLPGFVAGPTDELVWLEGLSFAPAENDSIDIGGSEYLVKAIGDIAGAGTFFAAVVARS